MPAHIVQKTITIRATAEQVWDALTNPEKTKQYFFKSRVYSEWKPGSPIVFKGKFLLLFPFEMKGTVLEVQPQKLLKYILKNNRSSSISTVTDALSYNNGITTLSVTDDVGTGEGAAKRYQRSDKGWDKVLSGLKKLLESQVR